MEKLNQIIFYSIDKAIRSYRQFAQHRLKNHGFDLTIDQWIIIKCLLENPGIEQHEIGQYVFKDNASVTRIVNILVENEYLVRNPHPNDRRKVQLIVTDLAVDIVEKMHSIVKENRAMTLEGIDQSDLETVRKVMQKIAENCEKERKA